MARRREAKAGTPVRSRRSSASSIGDEVVDGKSKLGEAAQDPLDGTSTGRTTRELEEIRAAYKQGDAAESARLHRARAPPTETHFETSGTLLKVVIFGGLDGIVTMFAIVLSCAGARLGNVQVAVVGLGNLLADALSMGIGEYTSSRAELEYERTEAARERWEMENCPDEEAREMRALLVSRWRFTPADASSLLSVMARYPEYFLHSMLVEELGILRDDQKATPVKRGAVMFGAFVTVGAIPLLTFVLVTSVWRKHEVALTSLISLIALAALGALKGAHLGQNRLHSAAQMIASGALAGGVSYGLGAAGDHIVQGMGG